MTTTVQHVKEFGFYPDPLSIKAGPVTISPLPDLDRIASGVSAFGRIKGDWIYAPHINRVFPLPKTHRIEHAAATNEEHLDFHLWALSFFVGMRLTATEAGFLDATPVRPGKLVDFVLLRSSLDRAVELAEKFWMMTRDKPCCAKRFAAAIHALFLSQNPQNLQFEKFVLLYTSIDACYCLAVELHGLQKRPRHAERIELMCKHFGIQCPGWAAPDPNTRRSTVAEIRNNTLHEALFKDAPLGFAVYGGGTNQNLPLEMQAFVCRLLVALIGGSGADYVRSPVTTRQRHGLDL